MPPEGDYNALIKCYYISIYLLNRAVIAKILTMINIDLLVMNHEEILSQIKTNVRKRRKSCGLTQKELAEKAGVTYASYRRFEETGQISLDSFVKIAGALECEKELLELFTKRRYNSIEEIINENRK